MLSAAPTGPPVGRYPRTGKAAVCYQKLSAPNMCAAWPPVDSASPGGADWPHEDDDPLPMGSNLRGAQADLACVRLLPGENDLTY